jgi:hypothetical protein
MKIIFRLINMNNEPTSTDNTIEKSSLNPTRVNIRFTIALAVPAGKFYQKKIIKQKKINEIFYLFFSIELSLTLIDDISSLLALCLAVSQDEQGFHCVMFFQFTLQSCGPSYHTHL